MQRLWTSSLRARLISAIILATVPLMALILYGAQRQYRRESIELEQEVRRLTAFITGDVNQLLEATRQILVTASAISTAVSPSQGAAILTDLAKRCSYYTRFGIVSPRSEIYGADTGEAYPGIDQELLARTRTTSQIAIGRLQGTSATGTKLLTLAYGVPSKQADQPPLVAFVVMDFGWLDQLLSEERVTGSRSLFPPNMILNILDHSGTILARYPDKERWTGKRLPDSDILQEILHKGAGSAEMIGVTGVRRFFAFESATAAAGEVFVSVGVSKDTTLAAARQALARRMVIVLAADALLLLAVWFGTGLFITRPVAVLVEAAQRVGAGDLTARTRMTRGPREIAHLAGVFDRMAETLQQEARQRERLQGQLLRYDEQLRSLSVEAVLAEERERQQIAAGLHDKVGPMLATCYMKLGRALKATDPQRSAATLVESRDLVDQAIAELRSLTFDLSSPALYTLGLVPAVEQLCREMAGHHALEIDFRDEGPPDVSEDGRVVLYRAAREMLFNVVKHAGAKHVVVTCGGDAEEVFLAVQDDGAGFDATDAGRGFSRSGGFGLFNLRERVTHLGGRVTVDSEPGRGSRIVVRLPVPPQDKQEGGEDGDSDISGG